MVIGLAFLPYFSGKAAAQGEMVNIPGETYSMDKYEVTQGEYEKAMGKNPSSFKGSDLPVETVTWYEAKDYCKKAGKRLPTDREWLKAARGGTTGDYYWGNNEADINRYAWYEGNSDGRPHPVGQKEANSFGLYDMAGNVWEWTTSEAGNNGQKFKVLRGGSWNYSPNGMRATSRITFGPSYSYGSVGFRCAQ
jgi:formylglycine-generating enzyme required for sulfatase activity